MRCEPAAHAAARDLNAARMAGVFGVEGKPLIQSVGRSRARGHKGSAHSCEREGSDGPPKRDRGHIVSAQLRARGASHRLGAQGGALSCERKGSDGSPKRARGHMMWCANPDGGCQRHFGFGTEEGASEARTNLSPLLSVCRAKKQGLVITEKSNNATRNKQTHS